MSALEIDEHFTLTDVYRHPFRAQCDYRDWAETAGVLASTKFELFDPALESGVLTQNDIDLYTHSNMSVVREFCEYGYNSRAAETAIVTASDMWSMMQDVIEPEDWVALKKSPALIRLTLVKLAKEAFVWGRTGKPFSDSRFGEEITAASTGEAGGVIFEEDIDAFARDVGDRVVAIAMPLLKEQVGTLAALLLNEESRDGDELFSAGMLPLAKKR